MNPTVTRSALQPLPVPPFFDSDHCGKCNICTVACPVASATPLFPGPKTVGPQMGRFWTPAAHAIDPSTAWCSGCGVCSRVCPQGVPVAEMNIIAPKRAASRTPGTASGLGIVPSRRCRPMDAASPIARPLLRSSLLRRLADILLRARQTGSARARRPLLSQSRRDSSEEPRLGPVESAPRGILHGCSTEDYEPWLGEMTIQVSSDWAWRWRFAAGLLWPAFAVNHAFGASVSSPAAIWMALPWWSAASPFSGRPRRAYSPLSTSTVLCWASLVRRSTGSETAPRSV
jgi:ferredoxin